MELGPVHQTTSPHGSNNRQEDSGSRSRSRSRSRSKEGGKVKNKHQELIMADIEQQKRKLKECYGQLDEDLLPAFVWGRPEQESLTKMLQEHVDERTIRRHFTNRYKEAIRLWQARKAKGHSDYQPTYEEYLKKEEQFHAEQERLRAFMRIQQGREQPIDKFVKMAYTYSRQLKLDKTLVPVMRHPKRFLKELTIEQLQAMLPEAQIHCRRDCQSTSEFVRFWDSLIDLIRYVLNRKQQPVASTELKPELKEKIKKMLDKPFAELERLQEGINQTIKSASFGVDMEYWQTVLQKLRAKKLQCQLLTFHDKFMEEYIEEPTGESGEGHERTITSPILGPANSVPLKLLTNDEAEKELRSRLAEQIFKEEFEKAQQKLQTNLSLPKNHNLLNTSIIEDVSTTYDFIAEEILEFERYKRLEEDQEQFNDWLPCETEGRFRDRRPEYINRIRVSCEWNKYNQAHYDNDNPPPKTVQGYKFNIFYPDLLDKSKTPQYYLEALEDPDYCMIKFKAGPPYLDVAFKIQRREWDFSNKSGFESIFAKGILHLYFNFKKPRFRI